MREFVARLLPVILLASSCCRPRVEDPPETGKLNVVVSILPQAYFVECVGGENVTVSVLVGTGQSPATYEPTPKHLAALENADVYFRIGVPFENSLIPKIRATYADLRVVDTRSAVSLIEMTAPHSHHDDGAEGVEHFGEEARRRAQIDPHIWLDPIRVKAQARAVCDALTLLDPERAEEYEKNLASFQGDLSELHKRVAAILGPFKGGEFFVFHPSFGYLADRYGLRQTPIEVEGKEPTAGELAAFVEQAKDLQARVIFVQAQFSKQAAEAIASEIGGRVVPLDPLAHDYIANLEDIARKMADALGGRE